MFSSQEIINELQRDEYKSEEFRDNAYHYYATRMMELNKSLLIIEPYYNSTVRNFLKQEKKITVNKSTRYRKKNQNNYYSDLSFLIYQDKYKSNYKPNYKTMRSCCFSFSYYFRIMSFILE